MLARRKPTKMNVRVMEPREDAAFRKHVRGFVCCAFKAGDCDGRIEAHHIREGNGGGVGLKPFDVGNLVPICAHHHDEGHRLGWQTWQRKHGIDLSALAERLAKVWPGRRKNG